MTSRMHSRRIPDETSENGSSLVVFLGVAATLMVMGAGLLMLVLNTQHSSRREATRTKAFNVAEAALDVAMMELAKTWPTDSTTPFVFSDATYASGFRSTFESGEFPNPTSNDASFVSVQIVDDEPPYNNYDYGPDGPNGRLIVDAQAVVGKASARVRATVQANYYPVPIAPDTAGHGEGGIDRVGGSTTSVNTPLVQVLQWPVEPNVPLYYSSNGTAPSSDLGAIGMQPRIATREEILPTSAIEDIVQLAKDKNRYFGQDADQPHIAPDGSEHTYSTASLAWDAANSECSQRGLIVIDAPGAGVTLHLGPGELNSEAQPGILMIMDRRSAQRASLSLAGNTTFWGLIYNQGSVELTGTGTCQIIGAVITDGVLTLGGTANIWYHAGVMSRLSSQIVTRARFVPGGWRELQPDPNRAP